MAYPACDRPLYNSRIIDTFVRFLRKKYGHVDLYDLLRHAGMQPYEVADEGHWFTQEQVDLFHERAVQITGNANISRQAGQYAASGDALGFMRKYILGTVGPANVFTVIKNGSLKFTRSSVFDSTRISPNKVEVTVTPVEGVVEKPFQCENRIGFFEALLAMFNYKAPLIEHPECLFHGGDACRYIITWEKTVSTRLKSARNHLILTLFVLASGLAVTHQWVLLSLLLPASVMLVMTLSFIAERVENKELHTALLNLRESTDDLLEQVGVNYNNALMVNEVGQAVSKQTDIDEVLENVIHALEKRLGYDRCLILLADPDKTKLSFRTGYGYSEQQLSLLKNTDFRLDNPGSHGIFTLSFKDQIPQLVNDLSEIIPRLSARSVAFAEAMGGESFICCPIICEGESLGILAVDNLRTKKPLVQSDMSLLMGIAPVIGISLRNAMYISRQRQMTEQLLQSQKMEAVGQLAGGIAHDFNNILTAVIGYGSLLQMRLENDNPLKGHVEQILAAAGKAANLTQSMLAFSRKQLSNPAPVELNSIVKGVEKLLKRLIREDIELACTLSSEDLPIFADGGQIEQVLMNLVANARDAMPRGGTVRVSTGAVTLGSAFVSAHGYGNPGRYAVISIRDTGLGMDKGTVERIFEPFFTTKETGKGTGLGLFMVYGIVKQHDGYIECASEPGKGTAFTLHFPLTQPQVVEQTRMSMPQVVGGIETILLAEDDPDVRKFEKDLLEGFGYSVIEAVDGEDAIVKFGEHREMVRLLILDVIMPKKNGREVLEETRNIACGIKALFISGYQGDIMSSQETQEADYDFISKPASPQLLLAKVREILDR